METKVLTQAQIEEAARILKDGGIVCFPTETVYGIGVSSAKEEFFDKLVFAKRRPPEKPFSLMLSSVDEISQYCEINARIAGFLKTVMPGEITVLLHSKKGVGHWIDLGTGVVGVRVPASDFVVALMAKVGCACLVTSANKSGEKTSTRFDETKAVFEGEVDAIVEGGCHSMVPSTIIDLTGEEPKLIRQGALSFEEISRLWRETK